MGKDRRDDLMVRNPQMQGYQVAVRYYNEYGQKAIERFEERQSVGDYPELWKWVGFYLKKFLEVGS